MKNYSVELHYGHQLAVTEERADTAREAVSTAIAKGLQREGYPTDASYRRDDGLVGRFSIEPDIQKGSVHLVNNLIHWNGVTYNEAPDGWIMAEKKKRGERVDAPAPEFLG